MEKLDLQDWYEGHTFSSLLVIVIRHIFTKLKIEYSEFITSNKGQVLHRQTDGQTRK